MRERLLEEYLVRRVTQAGGEIRKVQWIGRRGAPDRVVMLPGGTLIWVELKSPGRKPEPHQAREHTRLQAVGQDVRVVDSLEGIDNLILE